MVSMLHSTMKGDVFVYVGMMTPWGVYVPGVHNMLGFSLGEETLKSMPLLPLTTRAPHSLFTLKSSHFLTGRESHVDVNPSRQPLWSPTRFRQRPPRTSRLPPPFPLYSLFLDTLWRGREAAGRMLWREQGKCVAALHSYRQHDWSNGLKMRVVAGWLGCLSGFAGMRMGYNGSAHQMLSGRWKWLHPGGKGRGS